MKTSKKSSRSMANKQKNDMLREDMIKLNKLGNKKLSELCLLARFPGNSAVWNSVTDDSRIMFQHLWDTYGLQMTLRIIKDEGVVRFIHGVGGITTFTKDHRQALEDYGR